jgi:hypothetical protein
MAFEPSFSKKGLLVFLVLSRKKLFQVNQLMNDQLTEEIAEQ